MPSLGFGINQSEADPQVMARKIDAAVDHGVGMFLFDWYWYTSPTMRGIPDLQVRFFGSYVTFYGEHA